MLALHLRAFGLFPALGLCSCVAASPRDIAVPDGDLALAPEPEPTVAPIEHDSIIQPLAVREAAVRSGQFALAAGEFAAARDSLTFALAYEQSSDSPVTMAELRLAQIDALIGLAQLQPAKEQLAALRGQSPLVDEEIDTRVMAIREREHAYGIGSCEAAIDIEPRALARHDDFLAAWNDLRDGFPAKADLPIPTDEYDARELCPTCVLDEPGFVPISVDERMTWGMLFEQMDSSVLVMPELLLGTVRDSCQADAEVIAQRHGDLLWVRAFSDTRADFDPSDWELGDEAALGGVAPTPSPSYYAAGSSGYQGSAYAGAHAGGYAAGSSGYQGSGYQYSSGCGGGYDYSYESCMITHSIERDVFIDLARGEIVLDIIRTGPPTSPLGFVRFADNEVRVDACGVSQTLTLTHTI
jgi:hypothetical protein